MSAPEDKVQARDKEIQSGKEVFREGSRKTQVQL